MKKKKALKAVGIILLAFIIVADVYKRQVYTIHTDRRIGGVGCKKLFFLAGIRFNGIVISPIITVIHIIFTPLLEGTDRTIYV